MANYIIIFRVLIIITGFYSYGSPPLTMEGAIALMKKNNPEVRMLYEKQLLIETEAQQKAYWFLPTLSPIDLHYNAINQSTDIKTNSSWKTPLGGTLHLQYQQAAFEQPRIKLFMNQPIIYNSEYMKDENALIDLEIKQLQVQQKANHHFISMRKAYYRCLLDQLTIEHQKVQIEDIRQVIQHQEILYNNGELSKLEFEKVLNQQEMASIRYLKKEQEFELRLIELKKTLGIPLHEVITLDTSIAYQETALSPSSAIQLALRNNIEHRINKLSFKKAKNQHNIFKMNTLPKISLYGGIDEKKVYDAGIKIQLTVPVDDLKDTEDYLNYAHAQQTLENQNIGLRTTIHKQLISIDHQKKMVALSAKNLQLQQSIYQAESIKFQHQQISLEDFQKASDLLQKAYHESLQAQIEYSHLHDALLDMTGHFSSIINTGKQNA